MQLERYVTGKPYNKCTITDYYIALYTSRCSNSAVHGENFSSQLKEYRVWKRSEYIHAVSYNDYSAVLCCETVIYYTHQLTALCVKNITFLTEEILAAKFIPNRTQFMTQQTDARKIAFSELACVNDSLSTQDFIKCGKRAPMVVITTTIYIIITTISNAQQNIDIIKTCQLSLDIFHP